MHFLIKSLKLQSKEPTQEHVFPTAESVARLLWKIHKAKLTLCFISAKKPNSNITAHNVLHLTAQRCCLCISQLFITLVKMPAHTPTPWLWLTLSCHGGWKNQKLLRPWSNFKIRRCFLSHNDVFFPSGSHARETLRRGSQERVNQSKHLLSTISEALALLRVTWSSLKSALHKPFCYLGERIILYIVHKSYWQAWELFKSLKHRHLLQLLHSSALVGGSSHAAQHCPL